MCGCGYALVVLSRATRRVGDSFISNLRFDLDFCYLARAATYKYIFNAYENWLGSRIEFLSFAPPSAPTSRSMLPRNAGTLVA